MKDDVFALLSSKSPRATPSLPISIAPVQNESFINTCQLIPNLAEKKHVNYGLSDSSASKNFDDIELKIKLLEEQAKQFKVSDEILNDNELSDDELLAFKPIEKFKAIFVSSQQANNVSNNYDNRNATLFATNKSVSRSEDAEMKNIR